LVFGEVVFGIFSVGQTELAVTAPVALRVFARDGSGEPDAGIQLPGFIDLDDVSAGGFVGLFGGDHAVAVGAVWVEAAVEHALGNVSRGEGFGVLFGERLAQVDEAGGVVQVVMAEDHFLDVGNVDLKGG
jgi:hypothetical protein